MLSIALRRQGETTVASIFKKKKKKCLGAHTWQTLPYDVVDSVHSVHSVHTMSCDVKTGSLLTISLVYAAAGF